jgi:hypothetical protein
MFKLDSIVYETDAEMLEVILRIISSAKASNDVSSVVAVLFLGIRSGRIRKIGKAPQVD